MKTIFRAVSTLWLLIALAENFFSKGDATFCVLVAILFALYMLGEDFR